MYCLNSALEKRLNVFLIVKVNSEFLPYLFILQFLFWLIFWLLVLSVAELGYHIIKSNVPIDFVHEIEARQLVTLRTIGHRFSLPKISTDQILSYCTKSLEFACWLRLAYENIPVGRSSCLVFNIYYYPGDILWNSVSNCYLNDLFFWGNCFTSGFCFMSSVYLCVDHRYLTVRFHKSFARRNQYTVGTRVDWFTFQTDLTQAFHALFLSVSIPSRSAKVNSWGFLFTDISVHRFASQCNEYAFPDFVGTR